MIRYQDRTAFTDSLLKYNEVPEQRDASNCKAHL